MAAKSEIQERIDFYTDKIKEYESNKKYKSRLPVTKNLLNFWNNQMIKQHKIEDVRS